MERDTYVVDGEWETDEGFANISIVAATIQVSQDTSAVPKNLIYYLQSRIKTSDSSRVL